MAKAQPKTITPRGDGGYPYYTLAAALKLGEAVKAAGGRDVPKAIIASELKADASSSGFAQLCATAKVFGIVEGSRALSLTERGRDYFFPTEESSAQQARLGFFAAPPAFKYLIEKFDGRQIPGAQLLANMLQRERGVPGSWANRAAGLFGSAAEEVGVKDDAGFLRYAAALHNVDRTRIVSGSAVMEGTATVNATPSPLNQISAEAVGSAQRSSAVLVTAGNNVWQFSEEGGTVRLETPDPLPRNLWLRLKKYVEVLDPGSGQ